MKSTNILIIVLFLFGISAYTQNFQDKPGNGPDGDFPAKWDLVKGSQIMTFEGEKAINLAHSEIITPLPDSNNYLSDNFTLEFDAYFDKLKKPINCYQYYTIRFCDGSRNVDVLSNAGNGFYAPIKRRKVLL